MKEANLAKAIDHAAEQRANELMRNIYSAVTSAIKPFWHPQEAGKEWIGDDIRNVLSYAAAPTSDWRFGADIEPSEKLITACRAAIINDLLSGMPKLRELAQMAELYEVCPQCGTAPCHCEAAEAN